MSPVRDNKGIYMHFNICKGGKPISNKKAVAITVACGDLSLTG